MSDKSKGTGLGLSIVKSLVDLYFDIAEDVIVNEKAAPVSTAKLKGAKILLVEDDEINIYVAKRILEKVGCIVTVGQNGQEAIDIFSKAAENAFDAILMDVRMPVMDGLEATRRIRALKRADAAKIPIIAMTADAFAEEQKRTIEAGMNYHLAKPINRSLLYKTLCEFI